MPSATDLGQVTSLQQHVLLSVSAVGTVCLAAWLLRRVSQPGRLSLRNSPARKNSLHPMIAVLIFLGLLLANQALTGLVMALAGIGGEQTKDAPLSTGAQEIMILASMAWQLLVFVAALAIGRFAFGLGLRKGMGFAIGRPLYNTARGVFGVLAVLPLCLAVLALTSYLMPKDHQAMHPLLEAIGSLGLRGKTLVVISAVVVAPLAEECFFRGVLQSSFRQFAPNPWYAVLATSAVFALSHMAVPQDIPAIFVLSLALGYNYERCGKLWPSIVMHALFNALFVTVTLLG